MEVFAALDSGAADAAVIPIENSLAGSVLEHFDLLLKHDVKVVRETLLRIRHNLIAIAGARMEEIERVFSHPVALAQCRQFLAEHPQDEGHRLLRHGGKREATGGAARRHMRRPSPARRRPTYYGAEILEAGIEDNAENYTRFFLVRRAARRRPTPRRTR